MRGSSFLLVNKLNRSAPGVEVERAADKKVIELAKAMNAAGTGRMCSCSPEARELVLRAEAHKASLLRRSRGA